MTTPGKNPDSRGTPGQTKDKIEQPERLLTTDQLADYIQLRPQSVRKMRLSGRGPVFLRLGRGRGRVRYRQDDVDRWLSESRFSSTSEDSTGN
jgi:hypothetical protein